MHLQKMPSDFKPSSRFEKLSQNDTLYQFSTSKYNVRVEYACSNFYAPEFYYVSVADKSGRAIWNGEKALFLDTLFSCQFISDRFDKMILNRVHNTSNSHSQQIVLINLKAGGEIALTQEDSFGFYGHFQSFDAVFYINANAIVCHHFALNRFFLLQEMLAKHFTSFKTWNVCAKANCILVVTNEEVNNLKVFDVIEEKVLAEATLPIELNGKPNLNFAFTSNNNIMILDVATNIKSDTQNVVRVKHEYFSIQFNS